MDEHTAAILFGLAAVLIVGYTVYRAVKSHQLRKRLEDEAWQRLIGKPIPWEDKTSTRLLSYYGTGKSSVVSEVQNASFRPLSGKAGNYYSNPDKRPRKIANPMNSSAVDGYNAAMPDTFDLGGGKGFTDIEH